MAVLYGREGNRGFGVALAMRHRLCDTAICYDTIRYDKMR